MNPSTNDRNTTTTKKQKMSFMRRFSFEGFSRLCASADFEKAFRDGDLALAEVIAHRILNP